MYKTLYALKEKIKGIKSITHFYEIVFGALNIVYKKLFRNFKLIKSRILIKTHFCFGGKNADKVFFVISCKSKQMGLYSIILYVLPFIEYALKKGYIPVIDLKKYYIPMMQDTQREGLDNAWEYYYEQPIQKYSLDEVYESKHVILMVDEACRVRMPKWNTMFPTDEKTLKHWSSVINLYIRLNNKIQDRVNCEAKKIFSCGMKVLGVGIRAGYRAGMMRKEALYNGHPKVPDCEYFINIIEQKMKEWNCDCLFLACDDREYLNRIKAYYGEKCLFIERRLKHYFINDMPVDDTEELLAEYDGSSIKETTEEYIIETYLLAQCNSLYSCIGGGSEFAYFVNGGKYEHVEVYNEGVYLGVGK